MLKSNLLISTNDRRLRLDVEGFFPEHEILFAYTAEEAEIILFEKNPGVMIFDVSSAGGFSVEALRVIRRLRPHLPVIVLTAGDIPLQEGGKFLEEGIFYLLSKPISPEKLKILVESALHKAKKENV